MPCLKKTGHFLCREKIPMNKTVHRIVTLLLVLLMVCGMFPAAIATDVAPADSTTDATLPILEAPSEETITADDPTTQPTESTELVETTTSAESTDPTEMTQPTEATEPATDAAYH